MKDTITKFLVLFNGQIDYITFPAGVFDDQLYIRYEVVWGPDWDPISGLSTGTSQMARSGRDPEKVVFNFPVEMTFSSTNLSGWPQLIITVRAQNFFSGDTLRGYAVVLLPPTSGTHQLTASMFRPTPATVLGEWLAWVTGRYPELSDPKMLAHGKENYSWQTETGNLLASGHRRLWTLTSFEKSLAPALHLFGCFVVGKFYSFKQRILYDNLLILEEAFTKVLRTESYGSVTSRITMVSKELRKLGYDNEQVFTNTNIWDT